MKKKQIEAKNITQKRMSVTFTLEEWRELKIKSIEEATTMHSIVRKWIERGRLKSK